MNALAQGALRRVTQWPRTLYHWANRRHHQLV